MKRSAKVCWVGFVFSTIVIAAVAGLVIYFTAFRRSDSEDEPVALPPATQSEENPGSSGDGDSAGPSTSAPATTTTASSTTEASSTTDTPTEAPPTSLGDHLSHSVPGTEYREVDYDGDGYALVQMDGSRSHTHYYDAGPPIVIGKLIEMIWFDKESRETVATGARPLIKFPVGKTVVGLTVTDNFRDSNTDYATVIVEKPVTDGAYCYYYDVAQSGDFTISESIAEGEKPTFAAPTASIDFEDDSAFHSSLRGKKFQMRCVFIVESSGGSVSFSVDHFGPIRMIVGDSVVLESSSVDEETTASSVDLPKGEHSVQLLYSRKSSSAGKLRLTEGGEGIQYDMSKVLPVLTKIDPLTTTLDGGGTAKIDGIGLSNGVSIKFGEKVQDTDVDTSTETRVFVTVPKSTLAEVVEVAAVNRVGSSNALKFEYSSEGRRPVKFRESKVTKDGRPWDIPLLTGIKYGPDHRFYATAIDSVVYSFAANSKMQIYDVCKSPVIGEQRHLLGLAFNPADSEVKLYVSASVIDWKKKEKLSGPFAWANGEILLVKKDLNGNCLDAVRDPVITGLPVSNHDHAVNGLEFDDDGWLHIQVGGFTNAGHNDKIQLGGIDENPFSGCSAAANINKPGFNGKITYSSSDPGTASQTGGDVEVYSPGWRNSFGITMHSNGFLYATDNGASATFGDKSLTCDSFEPLGGVSLADKLGKVLKGKYGGHPNRNRGRDDPRQCVFRELSEPSDDFYQAPVATFESSTDGVIEYTADVFDGQMKGDLLCSKYSTDDSSGKVFRVQLDDDGELKAGPDELWSASGLSIQMGQFGHILMPRVYKREILALQPVYSARVKPMLIAVMPFRGPKGGGNQVIVTGENFGSSPVALFDGKPCTDVTDVAADGRSFKCKVPAGPSGKGVQVSLEFSDSTLNVESSGGVDYRYMKI